MSFLNDVRIASLVRRTASPLASPIQDDGFAHKNSPVQACTLDLTIGGIYVPSTSPGKPGSAARPRKRLSLAQGQTAVVVTAEALDLPEDLGAIALPPSTVSIQGLLMTNPGHVDPGYKGTLHCAVINMGSEPYELRAGDRIVRVLFFELTSAAAIPYRSRVGRSAKAANPVTEELLETLSHDFMNVTERSETAAKNAIARAEFWPKIGVPIFTALISALVAIAVGYFAIIKTTNDQIDSLSSAVAKLDGRVGGLGGTLNLQKVDERIAKIEKKVEEIK